MRVIVELFICIWNSFLTIRPLLVGQPGDGCEFCLAIIIILIFDGHIKIKIIYIYI